MNGAMEPPRPGAPGDQAATDGGERTEQTLEQEIASLRKESAISSARSIGGVMRRSTSASRCGGTRRCSSSSGP